MIFTPLAALSAYAEPLVAPSSPTLITGAINFVLNSAAQGLTAAGGASGTNPIIWQILWAGSGSIPSANAFQVTGQFNSAVGLVNVHKNNLLTKNQPVALAAKDLGTGSSGVNGMVAPIVVVRRGTIPANP